MPDNITTSSQDEDDQIVTYCRACHQLVTKTIKTSTKPVRDRRRNAKNKKNHASISKYHCDQCQGTNLITATRRAIRNTYRT